MAVTCHMEESTCHFDFVTSAFFINYVNDVNIKDKIKTKVKHMIQN